jgi:hypothetical protein
MATDLLNTNIGPERVEVIPQPTGVIQIPGAATAITAFILRSTKAGAPTDTPVSVTSLDSAVDYFGNVAYMGNAYYSLQGFYDNAGTGNEAVLVNVSPTASGGVVYENGVAEVADAGYLIDENVILTNLDTDSYSSATGVLALSGAPDLSSVKAGDYFKDDEGRLFLISGVDVPNSTLTIPTGLNTLANENVYSSSGLKVGSTIGKVLRLFTKDRFNSYAVVQAGDIKGTVTLTGTPTTTVSSSGGFANMGTNVGDILIDSATNVFYVTSVISDDQVTVDRTGATGGTTTAFVYAGVISTISETNRTASSHSSFLSQNTLAFSTSAAGYGILPVANGVYPIGSLDQHFAIMDSVEYEIDSSEIVASGTVDSNFSAAAISATYTSSTGAVVFASSIDLSTVVVGDVWRDAANTDFIINKVDDGTDTIWIAPGQIVNNSIGSSVRRGQTQINFVDTSFVPDTISVPTFFEPANKIIVPSDVVGVAAVYFIADAVVQDSDYVGTAANGKGLHALDNVDDVGLVCVPSITSKVVQNALIDYCETYRGSDCVALLMIPENIRTANVDAVIATVSVSTVVNGITESTVTLSGTPSLVNVSIGDLLVFGSSKYLITNIDDTDHKVTVESTSISGSGAATIVAPSAVTYKEFVINNPSKVAAWYYNFVKVLRSTDSAIMTVDPIGHVAGVIARIDANISIGGVSKAPAGISAAGLAGTVGLDLSISEKTEGGPLRLAYINRITEFPGAGRIIFGAYTADSGTSPAFTAEEQLIQVIRTNLFIKKSLESGLRAYIWENFSPATQLQAENAIKSFLRNNSYLFPAGVRENDQFRVISVTPTSEALAKGLMKFRVQVRTNIALRFMEIALEFPIPQVAA